MSVKQFSRNIGSMSIAVMISRIFGLLRDVVMTYVFGTSWVADAFQVGYQIPNLLRRLFGEGALSHAFVPVYNEKGVLDGRKEQIKFALNIISILSLLLLFISIAGVLFAPLIVKLLAPGFDVQRYELAVKLTRLMFPYLYIIGISSTLIAILNSHNKMFIPGLSSAFLNLGIIGSIGLFHLFNPGASLEEKVFSAGAGVLIGGILQTIVNFPLLTKLGYRIKPYLNLKDDSVKLVGTLFLPGVFGLAIRQINLAADMIIASFLPTGSIAALNYSNRLVQLPLGIIGVSAGVAALPIISRYCSEKNWQQVNQSYRFGLVTIFWLMLPMTAMLLGLGEDMIKVIYMRGAFDAHSVAMTNFALVFYSLGIAFTAANRQIIVIFHAHKNTRTPVLITIFTITLNIILNLILMRYLQHGGLALSTSITAFVYYQLLRYFQIKLYPEIKFPDINWQVVKIVLLSIVVYAAIYLLKSVIAGYNFWTYALRLAICGSIGLGMIFGGKKLLRIR